MLAFSFDSLYHYNTMNILAINFGGIGDEILFLPALISLKKEFPDAHITLALEPRSAGVKDLTDVIDEVVPCGKSAAGLLQLAWGGKFDMVISSGSNPLIAVLLRLTGIKKRYGYDTGPLSRLLLTRAVPLNKNQYAAAMYHDLVPTAHKTPLPVIDVARGEKIPNSVLIHPGVSKMSVEKGMIKTISGEAWAQIINRLEGKHVMLVGGPDDEELIKEILQHASPELCKTTSLRDLVELIARMEKFVCSDSAPLHIAVAVGTKTYTIFGPTDEKKLAPPEVTILKTECNCRPCLWDKRQTTCGELDCLKIDPAHAAEIICR
jgi:ADP-heptose:LPS heptosyltransferase